MKRFTPETSSGAAVDQALWQHLAASQDTALAAEPGAVGPERVVRDGRTLTSRFQLGRPRPRLRAWPIAVGAAAAVAGVFLVVSVVSHRPALRVQVADDAVTGGAPRQPTSISTGSSLIPSPHKDLPLQFSDGSTVTFRAGSSGRMLRLDATGADVLLERGTLQAHVIHADRTAWQLHAGPFRVRVTGTRFGLSWRADKLDLALYEGSVIVDGDVLGAGVPVTTGHRLTVASGVVRIEPLADVSSSDKLPAGGGRAASERGSAAEVLALDAPAKDRDLERASGSARLPLGRELAADEASAEPQPTAGAEHRRSSRAAASHHRRHKLRGAHGKTALADAGASSAADDAWLALADKGAYPEALAAAQRIGWSSLCLRLDAHRLLTLADVARYSNARGPARQAFEALVKRFPDDRLAADAVFSLGRLAFEGGNPPVAARWFRRYVTDWPNGPLAEQAAGRLVETTIRMEDSEAARGAARAYLARAPHGAQAALARGVLAEPSDGAP